MRKNELTANQLRAITYILENNSIEETARRTKVSRGTIYNWLKQDLFKARLEQERKTLFEEGLNALKGATAKAAKTLIDLLDCKDRNTRRLAAKEIISMAFKANEIKELEERIDRLEEILEQSKYKQKRY